MRLLEGGKALAVIDWTNPPEEHVQRTVADWLDRHGVRWFHPPNEGRHKAQYRRKLAALGLKPGVPDVMIVDPPPNVPGAVGTAIELKRKQGGQVSQEQREWLEALEARGWYCAVCKGIDEALELLERLGYGQRRAVG